MPAAVKGYNPTGRVRYLGGDKIEELENGKWVIAGPTPQGIGSFEEVVKEWAERYPDEARKIADRGEVPGMIGLNNERAWVRSALGLD